MILREIDTGVKSASWNMACDDVLLKNLDELKQPILRFLSFERCVLAGYFQSVDQEIRTEYCLEKDISINRRITGGGTIYFDPSQVGWEIIAPIKMFGGSPSKLYEMFGKSVAEGLSLLGIKAEFKPRNDIEVGGKKISGMGGVTHGSSFLFQGTLLVADLIEEMLYSLRVPVEKLKPKEIDSVRERVTCIEHELGRIPTREELKNVMKKGFSKVLGIKTESSTLSADELEKINESIPHFSSQKWINRIQLPEESQGLISGSFRSRDFGTIKINTLVNTKQKMLRSSIITGDFFLENPTILYDLERLLKNIHIDENKILEVVEEFLTAYEDLPVEDFKSAFREIFKKLSWVNEGFTPKEANHLFAVNFKPGEKINPRFFLFPYCAKGADCEFRFIDKCPQCSECTVGDGYKMAIDAGLIPLTVTSFENLLVKFDYIKSQGGDSYIGSCCEPFYIKHQEEFIESGLAGLLVNVKDSTCYDLGKAHKAYAGTFENQTNLELDLVKKVIDFVVGK
jgi:lipoate---protein ligase